MSTVKASVEEQLSVLLRGVEYGDPNIEATMRAELAECLAQGRPLRVYAGFDPTFTGLTLGNLVPMLKLRQFQRFGHEVTFLMGTMTAMIGDPSDKTATRRMLTAEEVEANTKSWLDQAYRVLDRDKTVVQRNGDWLAPLSLAEVVDLASSFTVAQFLEHETFRKRMAENKPLYIHEFIYALMQAYDAFTLETDVQVGGVDQLFNIMAGRHLQRARGARPLVAICTPLLIGTDGNLKMSKSVGNSINLDEAPAEVYGKVMSIPDSLIANYFTLLTDVASDEVGALAGDIEARRVNPMAAKKRLAREIVALLSGEAAADGAAAEFEHVFQRREEPVENVIEVPLSNAVEAAGADAIQMQGMTRREIDAYRADRGHPIKLATFIAAYAGVSMSAARRLINDGAVQIDGEVVAADKGMVNLKVGSTIRVGRHRFLRVVAGQ